MRLITTSKCDGELSLHCYCCRISRHFPQTHFWHRLRKRNREHAKRSRQRKKVQVDHLLSTVDELREETEKLRQELNDALGEVVVKGILEEKKRKDGENFIAALRNPKNRIMDSQSLKFLKRLSKNLPKKR